MAEALSQTQLRQQQAEERERLDEEWTAIAEERRLLDEDKKRVIEERRRLEERRRHFEEGRRLFEEERRTMEDERRTMEDEKMLMAEDRQKMIEEREDIDRTRENALSSLDDSVRTIRRAARELAEEEESSSSSPEGRPAKRQRRTLGGPQMRSVSTAGPRSSRNGTDPLGLSTASDEIKNIWRQIEFPQEWTGANSDFLFEEFTKRTTRKVLPGNRPLSILDKLATQDSCLITRLRRCAPNLDNGPDHRCSLCRSKSRPCVSVDFTMAGPDNEPYDEEGQAKRWKLSIRND